MKSFKRFLSIFGTILLCGWVLLVLWGGGVIMSSFMSGEEILFFIGLLVASAILAVVCEALLPVVIDFIKEIVEAIADLGCGGFFMRNVGYFHYN